MTVDAALASLGFTFEDATIPTISAGRKSEPNPLLPVIEAMRDKRATILATVTDKSTPKEKDAATAALSANAKAKAFTETGDELTKELAKFGRLLTRAGTDANVTVRRKVDGQKLIFWVVEKIEKPRDKDADKPAE